MTQRMRFGIFLAPFHKPGINPTLALEQDLELIQWLDRCGYDEAWLGEHHSAGTEISASPEIMMAVASQRTRHIRLGSGVISVSYHNPLWVAERIVQLDHLTRGRVIFDATRKSYDLIARHVFPVWQGHRESTAQASARARAARPELADIHAKAVEAATLRYQEEAARRAG